LRHVLITSAKKIIISDVGQNYFGKYEENLIIVLPGLKQSKHWPAELKINCPNLIEPRQNGLPMFTPARDFLLETPWRIIIPNPNVNNHSL
jgi:hypothetical protein